MKKKIAMILCLVWSIMMIGCSSSSEKEGIATDVYYVDSAGNTLQKEVYLRQEESMEKAVEELLKKMENPTDKKELQSVIPKTVVVEKIHLDERNLELTFNDKYLELTMSSELLLRAAIVQTMVQLPDVTYVAFYIEDEPLTDSMGNAVGFMSEDNFVQNMGSSVQNYQETDLILYFANEDGTKLVEEKRKNVRYDANTSIEKLIVEEVMKGPESDRCNATLSDKAKLLGVSLKDGICYVNLNSEFLTEGYEQNLELAIYSIVNSVVSNGKTTRVQILTDGSICTDAKGKMDLRMPLSLQMDLMEK